MVRKVISVTPVVSTSAYGAADQVGGIQTLTGACEIVGKPGVIESIVILDKAKQKAAMTIFFFNSLPTVASSDNAALDITDAEMAKAIGHVAIAAADYQDVANSSLACKIVSPGLPIPATGSPSIYAVMMTTGTPTLGSTSDLVVRYMVRQD